MPALTHGRVKNGFSGPIRKNNASAPNKTKRTITNGDVLIWHYLWPEIANYFDVPLGQNPEQDKLWFELVDFVRPV